MKKLRALFVLCVVLALGVSLLISVEDAPETPYDESETLPYEQTPLFSNEVLLARVRVPQSASTVRVRLCMSFPIPTGKGYSSRKPASPRAVCDSLAVLEHSLRC